ncbi:MAG TPA: TolC family protein [Gammaproteobacteria bacterium]|nr:TolC family protein [Gammaproteobacteria bacterium]
MPLSERAFNRLPVIVFTVCVSFWAGLAGAAGNLPTSRTDGMLELQQAVGIALANNPGLAEKRARARAMAAIPPQVGTLPDPVLSFNAVNLPVDTFSTTQENMTQLRAGLSQKVPFPGKLRLRKEAAHFEAESANLDVDEFRLKLVRNVRIGWWNLFYLDRALEIVGRNKVLLRQFIAIAETKYKVGKGLQQDVLLAQVELSKLLNIEIQLKGARKSQQAQLNALLNRPTQDPVRLPARVPETLPEVPDEKILHRMALQARPLLASLNERIKAAQKRVDLAKKNYYPDSKLSAGYGFRSGKNTGRSNSRADFLTLGISVNLPIFIATKQARALDQRKAEMLKQQFALQDVTESVWSETSSALADYVKTRDQALLFKTGIIPQASQTVSSMLAGYQVNKVDFLNLVRSQITLYNFETQYWKALAGARQSLARLSSAVGKDISGNLSYE